MRIARINHTSLTLCALLGFLSVAPTTLRAAGVTVITHGLNGTTTGWVEGMGNALSDRVGGGVPMFRLQVYESDGSLTNSVSMVSGGDPLLHPSGEIIILLDWGDVAGGTPTTVEVASFVAPLLMQTDLIPGLSGRALAELPFHLVGHSRGGSLVCELSKRLGEAGVWVDQVTGLDTRPVGSDGNAWTYENVLFADSYYQKENFFGVNGDKIENSFWRQQTNVSGGYNGLFINGHSDVHLWYHGTIDLVTPTTDGDTEGDSPVTLTSTMRNNWWTAFEQQGTNAGFILRHHGGGDRLSTNRPSGNHSSPIDAGVNRFHDVGGGPGTSNRTALLSNSGDWPNPIRFELLSTNHVQQGDTATFEVYFQWAQPNTSTQTVEVLADTDLNPLNGNEILLKEGFATGTGVGQVGQGTIDVDLDGALIAAGDHYLFVSMTAGNRTRFLYAAQSIQVTASIQPFVLDISASTNSNFVLGINGAAGQTAVLEMSADGSPWLPVATNTLTSARWEIMEPVDPASTMTLFRAVAVNP